MYPNLNKILLDNYSQDGLLIASRVHNIAVCSQSPETLYGPLYCTSCYSRPLSYMGRLGLGFVGQRAGGIGQDSGMKF
jgi:hypothetical protein